MIHPSIRRHGRRVAAGLTGLTFFFATLAIAAPTSAQLASATQVDELHALAVQAFQQSRFPEAYGRFVALADGGHPASARLALWMCEHGLTHFGRDWDCAPHQVAHWSAAAGVAAPRLPGHEWIAPRSAPEHDRRR